MNDLNNNIKFNYLYRDGGNFKKFRSVIYKKTSDIDFKDIKSTIISHLIDALFFIPEKWNLPTIASFPFDAEIDHQWYEFISVEPTVEPATEDKAIEEFLKIIKNGHLYI